MHTDTRRSWFCYQTSSLQKGFFMLTKNCAQNWSSDCTNKALQVLLSSSEQNNRTFPLLWHNQVVLRKLFHICFTTPRRYVGRKMCLWVGKAWQQIVLWTFHLVQGKEINKRALLFLCQVKDFGHVDYFVLNTGADKAANTLGLEPAQRKFLIIWPKKVWRSQIQLFLCYGTALRSVVQLIPAF